MSIVEAIKTLLAIAFAVIGVIGVGTMFTAESHTGQDFEYYFKWALGAGVVFLAMAAVWTTLDREDTIVTAFDSDKSSKS